MKRNEAQIHTVRLTRSHAGFGFTITGQQPCVLSCIVRGSPAFETGLRAGDLVVGVNGEDVTGTQHDDVVRKIGNSGVTITLQIMERRHRSRGGTSSSSASDGENVSPSRFQSRRDAARQRRNRRHRHRSNSRRTAETDVAMPAPVGIEVGDSHGVRSRRSENLHHRSHSRTKVTDPTRTFDTHVQYHQQRSSGLGTKKRQRPTSEALDYLRQRSTLKNVFPNALVPPPQLRPSGELRPEDTYEQPASSTVSSQILKPTGSTDPILRALIGYCGSVEVPAEGGGSWNKLSTIRSALSRLKNDGRVHVLIILDVLPNLVRLINHYGQVTAEYAASRIVYYGAHPDDERYFGLVVTLSGTRPSLSCHMFRVLDPDHCRHSVHGEEALAWGITCHLTSRGSCREFPSNPTSILRCLASISGNQNIQTSTPIPDEKMVHRSMRPQSVPPQPVQESQTLKMRSKSPAEMRPESVPPHADPLEDKLSPRAIWKVGGTTRTSNTETEFKVPRPIPIGMNDKDNPMSNSQPNFFRRFVKTGGSFRKKIMGISQSHETLSVAGQNRAENNFYSSKPSSLSQHSVVIEDKTFHKSNAINLSHNSTLAHSEKSVYKTTAREAQLDDDLSRVARWATGFDCLLNDRQGIEIFTDFLKSEYSEENILFWRAVEKFRRIQDDSYRRFRAQEIFSKHLAGDAVEQINIDSSARDSVALVLKDTDKPLSSTLFDDTQLQIYNLMRMDSYVRFLKSDIYKNYMVGELELRPSLRNADNSGSATPERSLTLKAAKSSASLGHPESEEKKRRSLFPWIRRSKRFGKSNATNNTSGSSGNELKKSSSKSPSRSSSKKEVELDPTTKSHCRITFPDGSSTVIGPNTLDSQMTVRQCLQTVCSKRGLSLHATEIICSSSPDKIVDLTSSASSLNGKSLNLEPRVVFRLEIPIRHKTLGVRVKESKSLKDVVKQVCLRYNLRLEDCVCTTETSHSNSLPFDTCIKDMDHTTIILRTKNDDNDRGIRSRNASQAQPVIEWLSAPWVTFDQSGIYDPQSPGISKPSTVRDKKSERRIAMRKSSSGTSLTKTPQQPDLNDTEDERFLDLLSRMTNQRLDDQRGNLSNSPLDLPDFLKPKNSPPARSSVTPKSNFPTSWSTQRSAFTTQPDMPFMDASTVMTSTPRRKSSFPFHEASPVFLRDVRREVPLTDFNTPPPPSFRDFESSGGRRSSRSTPSPSTHLLLPPDSPQYHPTQHFLQADEDRATFV